MTMGISSSYNYDITGFHFDNLKRKIELLENELIKKDIRIEELEKILYNPSIKSDNPIKRRLENI